jgi:integrase
VVAFATEAEARSFIRGARDEAQGRTVNDAVTEYMKHKRSLIGEKSATTLEYRLRGLLRLDERDGLLRTMTAAQAADLYTRRVAETKADTHRSELNAAKSFVAWCIKQKWIRANPFAEVEPVGKRSAGKPQLRVNEARKFVDTALGEGSNAGLAAACAVLMGLGPSEVTDRVVRDVDDDARLWWIDFGKTKNRRRHIIIPEALRPRLRQLVKGRAGDAPLWGDVDRHWLGYHVPRLCKLAGVQRVTPHGLRGLHSTLSVKAGIEVEHVARQLGHGGPTVTRRHYIAPGVEAEAGHERALTVIEGGRS